MYTCVTCGLQFEGSSAQKSHMKSEWHRYNLKRRVAQLPPIDEQIFNIKIAALVKDEEPHDDQEKNKQKSKREARRQKQASLDARRQELLAARDALQARKGGLQISPENTEIINSETEANSFEKDITSADNDETLISQKIENRVEIAPESCLFCPSKENVHFETCEENAAHMYKHHGLYIPERKYLVDLKGLLMYLGEKVGLGNCCLSCSYQGKDLEAVRGHMMCKRHMRIPYENEDEKLEISDYYDFSSTYGVSNPAQAEDEWEDISGDESGSVDDGDEGIHTEDSRTLDDDHYLKSETSLHLATGAIIGHRLLAKYYRQNLKPERILSEGQGTVTAAETRHFIKPRDNLSLTQSKRIWLQEKKSEDRNDRRAAKFINNQPHFRDPLLQ